MASTSSELAAGARATASAAEFAAAAEREAAGAIQPHGKRAAAEAALAAEAASTNAAGRSDTKGPASVESMDVEAPASPRCEQQRILDEASEALAERSRAVAHQRLNESETRPMRRFRKPGF